MSDFQRARTHEQIAARRTAILDAARAMLADRPVADVSLRELSLHVGLAKSNVLRYFDSREAIFLEVLDAEWVSWLDALEHELRVPQRKMKHAFAAESRFADKVAETIGARGLMCELLSVMSGVLERNISSDFARDIKERAVRNNGRLGAMACAHLPGLPPSGGDKFAFVVWVVVAGLWPYSNPNETVARVAREMNLPHARASFVADLSETLTDNLVGSISRSSPRRD